MNIVTANPWRELRRHTPARIALGRAGASLPTAELLAFGVDHARARDAVHLPLDVAALEGALLAAGWPTQRVHSRCPDRATYLLRPDLGRRLDEASAASLARLADGGCDLVIVAADGLSAQAVQRHVPPLLAALQPQLSEDWQVGPLVIAEQARVALGDEIGALLAARLVLVLIGERPGLSSPDSLGAYLTHDPRLGRSDAERNCVSNIRPEGLGYAAAAHRLGWLLGRAHLLHLTGVGLTDESEELPSDRRG